MSIDSLKLLMLSISISLPIFLVGSVIGASSSGKFSFLDTAFVGAGLSLLFSYLALLLAHIFDMTFVNFSIILGAMLIIGCLRAVITDIKHKRSEGEA